MHCKPIAASGEGVDLLAQAHLKGMSVAESNNGKVQNQMGVVTSQAGDAGEDLASEFIEAIKEHRFWMRSSKT
jgi:catalase